MTGTAVKRSNRTHKPSGAIQAGKWTRGISLTGCSVFGRCLQLYRAVVA